MKQKYVKKLNYDDQFNKCQQFIRNFEDYEIEDYGQAYQAYGRKKYMIALQRLANDEIQVVEIIFEDLESFFRKEQEKSMVEGFKYNTLKYIEIFSTILSDFMPKRNIPIKPEDEIRIRFENILRDQRRHNMNNNPQLLGEREKIPTQTHQNYDVTIVFGEGQKNYIRSISQLEAADIGGLVTVKAIVLRATDIKPELVVATYSCDVCGCENYVNVLDAKFKPLTSCSSKKCQENKVSGKLSFLASHSKFRSYQQLKIQQTPDQLGIGKIPQTLTLYLKGNNVKQASPGDVILVQGVYLPHRKAGQKHQNDLTFDCHLQAFKVTRQKKKYVDMAISEEANQKIHVVRANMTEDRLFEMLSHSIAPEIYGLEYVKKALLLMMVGGVTKETHDLLRIRGEINIALIGDPGIAKSQLLKHIAHLAPRAVYTTGKGSSGVGLTAAIVVDSNTKQMSLEAGALVLADMGVCCIDQFDKMDEYDRTAIHEVMEQQTVSIAKAGITTSLNARTSILAAANPLFGRYNPKQTPHKNINMPAALLSRFDLVFILLDKPDKMRDIELARHIGKVHQKTKSPNQDTVFEASFIRNYISLAKTFRPTISQQLHGQLIKKYVEKRQEGMDISKQGESYTTPRSLLALIRLCQARARLRFSNEVTESDVSDCLQLLEESQKSVFGDQQGRKPKSDKMSEIYKIIKEMCLYKEDRKVDRQTVEKRVFARGYGLQQLQNTLKNYEHLNVIQIQKGQITLIQ